MTARSYRVQKKKNLALPTKRCERDGKIRGEIGKKLRNNTEKNFLRNAICSTFEISDHIIFGPNLPNPSSTLVTTNGVYVPAQGLKVSRLISVNVFIIFGRVYRVNG